MMTTFIGERDVEELLHIVFRVPDSAAVMGLRAELLDLKYCHTDRALLELALAASYNGKTDCRPGTLGRAIEPVQTKDES